MGLINKLKNLFSSENIIGIDIGDSLIKLVEAETKQNKIILNNLAVGDTPKEAVVKGQIEDVEALTAKIKSLLDNNNFASTKVTTAISGEQVIIRNVEIPNMPEEEIGEAVRWEAKEQIPIPIDEAVLDYEISKHKADGGYEVMLVAVNRDTINRYLELFKKLDLEPIAIEIEPTAIIRGLRKLYPEQTIALLDMGAQTTTVSVFSSGRLLFTRTIGIAGQDITQEIVENYELDLEEAEEYKRDNNLFVDANLNLIIRNLTTAIYRSLDYFQVKYKNYDIEKMVLAGGGSKLIGFDTHLSNEFGIEVTPLNPLSNIESEVERLNSKELAEVIQLLGVSIGLALREEDEDDKSIAS